MLVVGAAPIRAKFCDIAPCLRTSVIHRSPPHQHVVSSIERYDYRNERQIDTVQAKTVGQHLVAQAFL